MPELKRVGGAASLAYVLEEGQVTPSCHVLYLGDRVTPAKHPRGGNGTADFVTQTWAAVLSVSYGDRKGDGSGARGKAGVMAARLLSLLAGWKPNELATPLLRASGMSRPTYENNCIVVPFLFEIGFVFSSEA
jgi:hypothetical protein